MGGDVTIPREYAELLIEFITYTAENAGYGITDGLKAALASPPPPSGLRPSLQRGRQAIEDSLSGMVGKPPVPPSGLREALEATKHWAQSKCPGDETKDPCPLCGAPLFDGVCKAVDAIFPKKLLEQINAALASPLEPAPAKADDGWVRVDETREMRNNDERMVEEHETLNRNCEGPRHRRRSTGDG